MPNSGTDDVPATVMAERRDIHPTDRRIRAHGFAIHSRKRGRHPEWVRGGVVLTQPEVETVIKKEVEKRA